MQIFSKDDYLFICRSKTKKVKVALDTLPIFNADFVKNLCERKMEGIALRKNESAKAYLIDPAEMHDDPIAKKYREGAQAAATTTTTTAPVKTEGEKRKRVQRKEPKANSGIRNFWLPS